MWRYSHEDFMICFGMKPVEKDPEMIYFRYIKESDDGMWVLDFSFCPLTYSFQVIFRNNGKEIGLIYSERTKKIEIRRDKFSSGVHFDCEISGCMLETRLILEPYLHCNWFILKNSKP